MILQALGPITCVLSRTVRTQPLVGRLLTSPEFLKLALRPCLDCASSHTARSHRLTCPHQELLKPHCSNKNNVLGPNIWPRPLRTPVTRGAAFWIRFKRHCTGQYLDCVLSRTVRTEPLPGEAAAFPRNPETDTPPKTCRFHIKSLCKNKDLLIL